MSTIVIGGVAVDEAAEEVDGSEEELATADDDEVDEDEEDATADDDEADEDEEDATADDEVDGV